MSFHQVLLHYWDLEGLPASNSLWPHGENFLHSPSVSEDEQSCLPHLCRVLEKRSQQESSVPARQSSRQCLCVSRLLLLRELCPPLPSTFSLHRGMG